MIALLLLSLIQSAPGQQEQRWVILPTTEAAHLGGKVNRQPTKEDIVGLEKDLPRISELAARGWKPVRRIDHPEQYFRQYLGVVVAGKKKIFINAFCNAPSSPDWHSRLLLTADGGSCFWHVTYDLAARRFAGLEINGRV
jgi:hypothetical protein